MTNSSFYQRRSKNVNFWSRVLLVLVIGTLAGLLGNDLKHSYEFEFKISQRDAQNLSDALERQIQSYIQKIDVVLVDAQHDFSPTTRQQKPDVLSINRDLLRREAVIPEAQPNSLRIIDAQGRVVFSAGDTSALPNVNVSDRAYFQTQMNTPNAGLVISEPLLSRFTGKWLFTLSRRISNPDGSFAGLIQTALRTDYFETGFKNIRIGDHGSVSLLSINSAPQIQLMARQPPLPEQIGKAVDLVEVNTLLNAGHTSGTYRVYSRFDGTERTYHFKKLEGLPLLINIGVAPEDLLGTWRNKAWMYALSFLMVVLELYLLISYQRREAKKGMQLLERKVAERTSQLTEANLKLETAMKAAEAANVAKSAFLANISHEMRTPLHQISSLIQLIKSSPLPDIQGKRFETLNFASQSLSRMIQSILDLTKIESKQLELQEAPVNFELLMQNLADEYEGSAQDKGIDLTFENRHLPDYYYMGDKEHIHLALANYIDNAIKFTDTGSIKVIASVTGDSVDDELRFEVIDTGIGIPADASNRIFSIFEQADNSSTRKFGGTGIGLAITKKIATLMGGEAGCHSEPGVGSTFWVTFKLKRA